MKRFAVALLTLIVLSPAASAYHLELEAQPAAVFPYFSKFGTIAIHVSTAGVRADTIWLDAFSRTGSHEITVMNPLARMYTEVPITHVASLVAKLGDIGSTERNAVATLGSSMAGKVGGLPAVRHRLVYGEAYIDYWTTTAIPENQQLRRLVHELLMAVSPGTAPVARGIRGTPIYVELNFRRFRKVPLVRMKSLSKGNDDLSVGRFYMKVPILDALWK